MGKKISWFFLIAFCAGLVTMIAYATIHKRSRLPVLGEPGHIVGGFSLKDQDGHSVTEANVRGDIRVVEYFFTTCKGICPIMGRNLEAVNKAFADRTDVIILSHTVDPGTDSVPVMHAYAARVGAKPGKWFFLTGDKHEIYRLAIHDYLLSVDTTGPDADNQFIHTPYVTLVDREDRIRGFYDATNKEEVKKLINDIKELE